METSSDARETRNAAGIRQLAEAVREAEALVGRPSAYVHIAEVLRVRIIAGALTSGALLPSEASLSAEFGVVRNTVRRALATLESEGLVKPVPGRGRVVCDPSKPDTEPNGLRYQRIASDLRISIRNGDLQPGSLLPSESSLMASYGVSRGTARQALAELELAGLVESMQGKGRYVRPD